MNWYDIWQVWAAGFGLVGWYVASIAVHPYVNCKRCRGTGKHRPRGLFHYAWRPCSRCDGEGKNRRLGSIVIGRGLRTVRGRLVAPKTPPRHY